MPATACQIAATVSRKGVQRGEISEAGTDRSDAALQRTSQACVAVCDLRGMLVMVMAASNVPMPDFATGLPGRREVFRGKVDTPDWNDAQCRTLSNWSTRRDCSEV